VIGIRSESRSACRRNADRIRSEYARAHNVNANLVFTWRRRYRQELLQNSDASTLLPVRIVSPKSAPPVSPIPTAAGVLHLELPHAHLLIEGTPDPATLRTILAHLLP
jgi:transposase